MDFQHLRHLWRTESFSGISMTSKLKVRRVPDKPSLAPLSNQLNPTVFTCFLILSLTIIVQLFQVTIPPKFQPTRGGARKRIERIKIAHHLRDENTDSKGEIQEVRTEEPYPDYQTRSIARKQAENDQSDKGDDSLAEESSSSGNDSDLDEGSCNEATSNLAGDSETMREDILKGKMPGFRDSLCWKVKRVEKYFQEGLTTTTRGHLKHNIAEEVRIIDLELLDYPQIEGKCKF
ncbi:hypothetical protein HAX54_018957 [Datura stramonium]|uniref:Uncharacterized protein n=1 Tax=Datura stramonium TaxID=4076 RepID=A0ABS8UNB0_DATST|nr:hypothetical protein [Datura stramonium]